GELKLVDFGVSAELVESLATAPGAAPPRSPSLAETQPLPGATAQATAAPRALLEVGTPLYAAPELLAGQPASRHSDLYAWGAVLYEVCAGKPPHAAASLDELKAQADAGKFAPLRDA